MGEPARGEPANSEDESLESCADIMSAVGTDFFHLLNRQLAKRLKADSVYIAEELLHASGWLQTLAAFRDGENIADYSYAAAGTPCGKALDEGVVICRGDLQQKFSEAYKLLPGLNSFMAVGLEDRTGQRIGALALGWYHPDPDIDAAWQSLQTVMPRVSAELERARSVFLLEKQLHLTQALLDAIPVPVFYKDVQFKYLGCNQGFEQALGLSRAEIIGKTVKDVAPEDFFWHYAEVDRQVLKSGEAQSYEGMMKYQDGSVREVIFNKAALHDADNQISGVIGTMFDVSALKNAEKVIHRLANYDPLTGLPNRRSFLEQLNKVIAAARQEQAKTIAVLCLDLDNFKSLGNSLGAEACNLLVQECSHRITACSRGDTLYARTSGDRFAIALLPPLKEQSAEHFAKNILATLTDPLHIDGQVVYCTGSIGIAIFSRDGNDANSLLSSAEVAMARAREQGGNTYQHCSLEINRDALERLTIEAGLRHSIVEDDFELYYQPQVELESRLLIGAEALLRWTHPKLGSVSPERFIPIAEESGLIVAIGEWVLRAACQQNVAWQAAGYLPIRVAVNLSGHQLRQKGFVQTVTTILKETGLDPQWLELELTESTMMEKTEENIEILLQLKKIGVNLSIDDFGTGYSSLSSLQRFPIDKLKIDQSFVKDLHKTDGNAAITDAIIAMAQGLGLKVIAEGIETIEQLDYLLANNCLKGQGYFFGRAVPGAEFEQHFSPRLHCKAQRLDNLSSGAMLNLQ